MRRLQHERRLRGRVGGSVGESVGIGGSVGLGGNVRLGGSVGGSVGIQQKCHQMARTIHSDVSVMY